MNLKATLALGLACLLSANLTSAATEKVYKWTDAKGQTHYSQRPPLNTETEVIKTKTAQNAPVDGGVETKPEVKAEVKPETKPAAKAEQLAVPDPQRCKNAREAAETLKNYARIKIKGENGEYRYLSPEEHQQRTNEANAAIKESCE